jgi:hypothetical protein
LLGEIGNARERGAGCPGIAASSMSPLHELGGPSAVAEVAELRFSNRGSATVTVNVALLR